MFKLPLLHYSERDLAPYLSQANLESHRCLHRHSIDDLNHELAVSPFAELPLTEVVRVAADPKISLAASRVWNHNFYWQTLCPLARSTLGVLKPGFLRDLLCRTFGSVEQMKQGWLDIGLSKKTAGWLWLAFDPSNHLQLMRTDNEYCPITDGYHPLLGCDLHRHAYELDYQHDMRGYLEGFWSLLHWQKIERRALEYAPKEFKMTGT